MVSGDLPDTPFKVDKPSGESPDGTGIYKPSGPDSRWRLNSQDYRDAALCVPGGYVFGILAPAAVKKTGNEIESLIYSKIDVYGFFHASP